FLQLPYLLDADEFVPVFHGMSCQSPDVLHLEGWSALAQAMHEIPCRADGSPRHRERKDNDAEAKLPDLFQRELRRDGNLAITPHIHHLDAGNLVREDPQILDALQPLAIDD